MPGKPSALRRLLAAAARGEILRGPGGAFYYAGQLCSEAYYEEGRYCPLEEAVAPDPRLWRSQRWRPSKKRKH